MKIRVVNFDTYEECCEENLIAEGKSLSELTDEEFMAIYKRSGNKWEFNSLKEFADEFNADGAYAPTPSSHIIHFFPNE